MEMFEHYSRLTYLNRIWNVTQNNCRRWRVKLIETNH